MLMDQNFDPELILEAINRVSDKGSLKTVSQSQVPIIHQLLNLYFTSRSFKHRNDIVKLIIAFIDVGIDVDEPFRSDPHVVFKSLMIRELGLSSKLANSSFSSKSVSSETIEQMSTIFFELYRVPCESVPLTKLLLHADTIIRNQPQGREKFGGSEGIKSLISAATPPIGAKPTVKAHDLSSNSLHFNQLMEKLGLNSSYGLDLGGITSSLDDLAVLVSHRLLSNLLNLFDHQSYLSSLKEQRDSQSQVSPDLSSLLSHHNDLALRLKSLLFALSKQDSSSRTPMHFLAVSGASQLVGSLVTHLKDSLLELFDLQQRIAQRYEEKQSVAGLLDGDDSPSIPISLSSIVIHLRKLLSTTDKRGHTPADYAAVRFGKDSPFFRTNIKELYSITGGDLSTQESAFQSAVLKSPSLQSDLGTESSPLRQPVLDNYLLQSESGGWSQTRLSPHLAGPGGAGETQGSLEHCDILEVWDGLPSEEEFFHRYLKMGQPVIFRGAAKVDGILRKAFDKERFLERYGSLVMPVSDIPYAGTFGVPSSSILVRDMADMEPPLPYTYKPSSDPESPHQVQDDSSPPQAIPYSFTTASSQWRERLHSDAPVPPCLRMSVQEGKIVEGSREDRHNVEVQFYLGPAGSGAPPHYHGHAANTLAYGEKKWFLFPPAHSFYSTLPSLTFLQQHQNLSSKALRCIQRSGDIMYVPTLWGHLTLNLKQSIGVAHEFTVEPFCME